MGSPSRMAALQTCFAEVAAEFAASPAMIRLASGDFTVVHYKEYLRQVYYYTRENPQLLALMTLYLRGDDRKAIAALLRHASEESDHDQWALNDLASLDEDVSRIPYENPLPETLALTAFAHYQITCRNPVAHLGYVYFLEFLPTTSGTNYLDMLQRLGVPASAMSFLSAHMEVDVAHNRLMEQHVERLVRTDADLDAVAYSMRVSEKLYAGLLQAAFEEADERRTGLAPQPGVRTKTPSRWPGMVLSIPKTADKLASGETEFVSRQAAMAICPSCGDACTGTLISYVPGQ